MNAQRPEIERDLGPDLRLAALVALGVMAVMLMLFWPAIQVMGFRDGDDALRLVQVRDLIAGQGWLDTTQYRINPPDGGLMHWSRLIDVQIAGLILLLEPFLGRAGAEQWAVALYPPLLLSLLFPLLAVVLRRISADRAVLVGGLLLAATGVTFLHYFVPLRIDHHNWQTILSVAMLAIALGAADRRHGLLAGAVMGLHLAVSLEAAPYLLIFGGIFALAWLRDAAAGRRLFAFVASLAIGAPLLLLATRGVSGVTGDWCDAWSWPYLVATAAASLVLLIGALLPPMRHDWRWRLGLLALTGGCGATIFAWQGRECLSGPFGSLEPLVRQYWYVNVLEGRPLWRQDAGQMALLLAPSLVSLGLTIKLWRRAAPGLERNRWEIMALVLGASLILSLLVARTTAVTHIYALPALAVSGVGLWRYGRSLGTPLARIAAALLLLLVVPPVLGEIAKVAVSPFAPAPQTTSEVTKPCPTPADLAAFAKEPPALILSAIDIGPMILVQTPHAVVATGHHRNHAAMNRVIGAFAAAPAAAAAIVRESRAEWLLICPDQAEIANIAKDRPASLAAELRAGRVPAWLAPAKLPPGSAMQLYRVVPPPA